MLMQTAARGRADALRTFGLAKQANDPAFMTNPAPAAPPVPGLLDRAKAFGQGQLGAAKSLAGNLHQGLGGAPTAEAGMLARQNALGNMRTLAPSLLAGGAMYMLHRHNEAKRQQMQQQAMMAGGGYPGM